MQGLCLLSMAEAHTMHQRRRLEMLGFTYLAQPVQEAANEVLRASNNRQLLAELSLKVAEI